MTKLKQRKFLVGALVIIVALFIQACGGQLAPQEPCNFVQNSQFQRVSWQARVPVKIYLHSSVPYTYYSAIEGAIEEWNQALGKEVLRLELTGVGGYPLPSRDGANVIYRLNTWEENRRLEQARTTLYWAGNRIYEADIRLNGRYFRFYKGDDGSGGGGFSGVDLRSLMVHELGHVLGFSHNDRKDSVMYKTLPSGTLRRKLGKKDVASAKCEYK